MTTTLITGATREIGKAIANGLLNANYKIINISKSGIIPTEFKDTSNFSSCNCDISN